MPRNPNGEYVLPSIYLAASGQTIRADQHNIPMQDIAQALTGSMARNGSTPMTGNLAMNSNRITGLAAATASSDAVRLDQVTKYSGYLNAVSSLALAANEITYATGPASAARTALTPFGRSLIAAVNAAAGRTALALGPLATATIVPVGNGGTGGTTQATARNGLGLGAVATDNVVPVARGGTGATNAAGARGNIWAPERPQSGTYRVIVAGNGVNAVVPSGGQWAYWVTQYNVSNGEMNADTFSAGVVAGGTVVRAGLGTTGSIGVAWRIA